MAASKSSFVVPLHARRTARRIRRFALFAAFFAIGAGAALLVRQTDGLELSRFTGLVDTMTTSAYAPEPEGAATFLASVAPRPMPLCGSGRRVNCVVDGDTLWLDGEKIRIVNIDAPEVKGRCRAERERAATATRMLASLVSNRPIRLDREGRDRYGRTLASLVTPEGDVGSALVAQRLAVHWRGRREPAETWCGA
ncbi:thermonuclease family protein [Oricola thermophila]|uniref:Thermonuclease family protein n=1 Tax=Oricola thermophila TaxID=2742145 RepID=A0A6N1VFM3_9HYPH|nr:thermonuclease family protein [Oricola thermophila]QKV19711.1 thermonuclease family protein [Oricola thermophila]